MGAESKEEYLSWKNWSGSSFGEHGAWHAAFFKAELKKTGLKDIKDVLEVGFGNGEFISFCSGLGFNTVGVEISSELVRLANEKGFEAYSQLSDIHSGKRFDLVVIFDVLEHIEQDQIPVFLSTLKSLLTPGGVILARFPNGDSPFGRPHQHGDVTHKTTIGSEKVRYFAEVVGLEVRYCGAPSMPVIGSPVKYAIYNFFARPLRGFFDRFFGILYLQRRDITFSPNLTVVLVRD